MRIIQSALANTGWSKRVVCTGGDTTEGCRSLLEIKKEDLYDGSNYYGEPTNCYICPCCHQECHIGQLFDDLPDLQLWLKKDQKDISFQENIYLYDENGNLLD